MRWMIWTLVIIACWSFAGIAAINATMGDRAAPPSPGTSFLRVGDPPEAKRIELPKVDVFGRKIDAAAASIFLIYGGGCSSCSLNRISFKKLPFAKYRVLVIFYDSAASDIPVALKNINPKLRVVADSQGKLADILRAAWIGRWYELQGLSVVNWQHDTSDGRLRFGELAGSN